MVASVVHEVNRLQAQIDALERENAHLKEIVRVQADRLCEHDHVVGDRHWTLGAGKFRW